MAVIKCPDCGGNVSTRAASCPHCGSPMGKGQQQAPGVRTTQSTGKQWKALQLLGGLIALVSVPTCAVQFATMTSREGDTGASTAVWMLSGLIGMGLLAIGRLGAWWHHH